MIMIVWNLVSSCLTILPIAEWCYYKWEFTNIIQSIITQANCDIQKYGDSIERDWKVKKIDAQLLVDRTRYWVQRREFVYIDADEEIAAETKKYNEKSLITKPLGVLGFAMLAAGKVWQIYMQN